MSEILGAVTGKVLFLLGLAGVLALVMFFVKIPDQMDAGDQLQRVADQAKVFMTVNFSTGAGCGLPPGGLVAATMGGVQEYSPACIGMPATWQNANVYGQTHTLKVFQPTPGAVPATLYGLVQTCGGDTVGDTDIAKAAARAQPDGGLMVSTDTANFQSAGGKWTVPAAPFNTAACPNGAGHLAALVVLDGAQVVPPFLHRFAVGSDTEPNTMHTNLLMGGNPIENVQDVQLSNGKYLSSAIMDAGLATDGQTVTKPTCPRGSPAIYVAPAVMSDAGIGRPLVGIQAYAINNGSTWTVKIPVYTTNADGTGTVQVAAGNNTQALYLLKCQ